ncbi:MAG: ABC transporter substrate-binding protein [Alphaproteobacteria bacterium]
MKRILSLMAASAVAGLTLMPGAEAGEKAIRIGILTDQNGPYADIVGAGSIHAAQMAVQDFGGKVLGKPIEVLGADTQNKPDVASAIARKWFDTEGVDVILDLPVTSIALAVQAVARDKKKVVITTAAASAVLTGKECSPTGIHWMDDTDAMSTGTARAVVAAGGTKWFFLTPDYVFGAIMQKAATDAITAAKGEIVGSVKFPLSTPDYSSALVTAGASTANIFAFSTVGGDTLNAIKQASEFGLTKNNRKIVVFLMYLNEVHGLGLKVAQGLYVTDGFYWDENEATRAWSKRYFEKMKKMPSKTQAFNYIATTHYLKAVQAAGTDDGPKVTAKMKEMSGEYLGKKYRIRKNGRVMYDLTLNEVKSPAESKYAWDYMKPVRKITAEEAFGATEPGDCVPAK